MSSQPSLDLHAESLFQSLIASKQNLVLAESCTGGLIAATLARMPGISEYLAGSFVVYQIDSKVRWLGVSPDLIAAENVVSEQVAASMAERALICTPHASVALGITGHLGPGAPPELDGVVWIAVRATDGRSVTQQLRLPPQANLSNLQLRHYRQQMATEQALVMLQDFLNAS